MYESHCMYNKPKSLNPKGLIIMIFKQTSVRKKNYILKLALCGYGESSVL